MTDAEELANFLTQLRHPGANRSVVEARIFARFGCTRAVMFTDLVEAFGIVHFLQLIQESEALFLPLISQHQGQCLKREGDSLLVVFEQAQNALDCAQAMVAATVALNPGRVAEDRIEVCIGLGYGHVLRIGDNEVWGAEVNAASKLGEEMAKGDEILVTDSFAAATPNQALIPHGTLIETRTVFRVQTVKPMP